VATDQDFFDRYSIAHAAVGSVFAVADIPFWCSVASHVGFELIEDQIKDATLSLFPTQTHDSWRNHVGDVVSFSVGYRATESIDSRKRPLFAAAMVLLGGAVWTYSYYQLHGE